MPLGSLSNLITTASLEKQDIESLFAVARLFRPFFQRKEVIPFLKGMTVAHLFFENSTRTRISFEVAVRQLGGNLLNFTVATSSVQKGESLMDTAKNIVAMGPQCLVLRHPSAGAPVFLSKEIRIPIVNAGDGFHEHPTQALLDVFTMQEKLGSLEGKRVVIVGDLIHSRVARSNLHLLKKLGASVVVCGPGSLLPAPSCLGGIECSTHLDELLPDADVVMSLRIQLERHSSMQIPSLAEYSQFWGMTVAREKLLKKNAIILHPGPINRGVELDPEVADGSRSVILDQVLNGVLIRMAVFATLCHPKGLTEWLEKK